MSPRIKTAVFCLLEQKKLLIFGERKLIYLLMDCTRDKINLPDQKSDDPSGRLVQEHVLFQTESMVGILILEQGDKVVEGSPGEVLE